MTSAEHDLEVARDVELARWTTLELGGPADHFFEGRAEEDVTRAVAWARARGLPLVVLGGGSNLIVADGGFRGVVLKMATRGLRFEGDGTVVAAAGEPWDAFVDAAIARGLAGVECLAGIPGLVGATPIQNVGAYGQEVAETIREVRVLERASGGILTLPARACGFGYRDSVFRRQPSAYVVLAVTFALRPGGAPALRYRELQDALSGQPTPSVAQVAATVRALRRGKSMLLDAGDPNRRSVGSFFTNAVLDAADFAAFAARAVAAGVVTAVDQVPRFATEDGRFKVPAAWLIERAGFPKGLRRGPVGISSAHALALVHFGGGSTTQLLALADEIRAGVAARFGVTLSREPVLLDAHGLDAA
ncbi:MAG TPA: UDP-N-acetylmuramate dehydrogenase [Polyangia bacterium]|nr:UDP-N-acetylmuramate dehydrogenase [Polyangia bacterium]